MLSINVQSCAVSDVDFSTIVDINMKLIFFLYLRLPENSMAQKAFLTVKFLNKPLIASFALAYTS